MKFQNIVLIFLIVVLLGLLGWLGYYLFSQEAVNWSKEENCGDGFCSYFEEKNSICPRDCPKKESPINSEINVQDQMFAGSSGPIYIGFTLHFDPLGNYSKDSQASQADYESERDNLAWLYDYFEELKKQKGKEFTPHLNLEFGGDQAEYYLEDSTGLNLLKKFYGTGDEAWGVHFHDNGKRIASHEWESVKIREEKNVALAIGTHVSLVDELISKIIASQDETKIRQTNTILTGWIPSNYKYKYGYGEYGFSLETGGRTEGFNAFFDHDVFNPFRTGDSPRPLVEDRAGEVLVIGDMPNLGAIEEHAGKYQDSSLAAVKRKFLQVYLERWWQNKKEMSPKIWSFGWSEHPANLYEEGSHRSGRAWHYHRDEIKEMINWLNDNFINQTDSQGNLIASYSNAQETKEAFLAWEKFYPDASSFNYQAQELSWDNYPYFLKPLAEELKGSHYREEFKDFRNQGVKIFKLTRCENGLWQVRVETEESYCSGSKRDIYLAWSEGGDQIINFSGILSGKIKFKMGASGEEGVSDTQNLKIEEEPMVMWQ